jgi:hypothetical protein
VSSTLLQAPAAASMFAVCLATGFILGSPKNVEKSRSFVGTTQAPALSAPLSLSKMSVKTDIWTKADQIVMTEVERGLAQAMDVSPVGTMLRKMLVSGNHSDSFAGSEELGLETLKVLQKNPTLAAREVLRALDLKELAVTELAAGRAALLVTLSRLPGHEVETQAAALREITEHAPDARPDYSQATTQDELDRALSSTPETAAPLIAHAVFMESANDIDKSFRATIDGIVAQKDAGIRNTLGEQFLNRYPEAQALLTQALLARGISIDLSNWRKT